MPMPCLLKSNGNSLRQPSNFHYINRSQGIAMSFNAFISYSHAADGRLAPALQRGLEKFAKPWYKLRNLNIFRDESTLSASPHLWSNIEAALRNSEHLLYMASPQAAASKWVQKEIMFWLEHKSPETLIIVLTDGEIEWDKASGKIASGPKCAVPEVLIETFGQEPFYIDLRECRTETDLSLDNPLFNKEVLKLAAHLHGKPPKDMAGEEVLAHRRTLLIRNTAVGLLTFLLVVSAGSAWYAVGQKREAELQAEIARDSSEAAAIQRNIAQEEARRARQNEIAAEMARDSAEESEWEAKIMRDTALEQERLARLAQRRAEANLLMVQAKTADNPSLAMLYAKEALQKGRSKTILREARKLYAESRIYKEIRLNFHFQYPEALGLKPDGSGFIAFGTYHDLNLTYGLNIPRDYFITEGDKSYAEGEGYWVFDFNGNLTGRLTKEEYEQNIPPELRDNEFSFQREGYYLTTMDERSFALMRSGGEEVALFSEPNPEISLVSYTFLPGVSADKTILSLWSDGTLRWHHPRLGTYQLYQLPQSDWTIPYRGDYIANLGFLPVYDSGSGRLLISLYGQLILIHSHISELLGVTKIADHAGKYHGARFSGRDTLELWEYDSDSLLKWIIPKDRVLKVTNKLEESNQQEESKEVTLSLGGEFATVLQKNHPSYEYPIDLLRTGGEFFRYAITPDGSKTAILTEGLLHVYQNFGLYDPEVKRRSKLLAKHLLNLPDEMIIAYRFSPDGKTLVVAAGEHDRTYYLVDPDTGDLLWVFPRFPLDSPSDWLYPGVMEFSPDGGQIALQYGDKLTVWNIPMRMEAFISNPNYMGTLQEHLRRIQQDTIRIMD